jgi:hypothetical protein
MIGTALDQAQKLFSRGFVIAAFVPSLLFATVVACRWWGFATLKTTVQAWAQKGLKESAFEILLVGTVVYLLAYVLYGIRTAIHQLYQGEWPIPLKWLRPVGLALVHRAMGRCQARLREKEVRLDDPAWAIDFDFAETYASIKLALEEPTLQKVRDSHQHILRCLEKGEVWQEKMYLDILHEARILQANRDRFSSDLQKEVDRLVGDIQAAYKASPSLRTATTRLNALALREWTAAYTDLMDNFPDDERWLRPTQLGNMVSVLELHPLKRYGITLSSLWPRLMHVISKDARLRIEDANIYLDFTVLMSLLSLVAAGIVIIADFYDPPSNLILRIVFPFFLLLSFWLFYRLAIQATRTFGIQILAAVDLFRLKLLDALDIERPGTVAEEQQIWKELHYFIVQADLPEKHVRFKEVEKSPGKKSK